jgi:hypothetical protein
MTAGSQNTPIRTKRCQQPKRGVSSVVLLALLAIQMLIADAHAESSPSFVPAANLNRPTSSLGKTPKKERVNKERSRSTTADRGSCWHFKYKQGRWKRTNVCFSAGG